MIWSTPAVRCAKVTTAETTAKFLSCRFPIPGLSWFHSLGVSFPWLVRLQGPLAEEHSEEHGPISECQVMPGLAQRSKVLHFCKGVTWSETCGKANMHLACAMYVSKQYPEQTRMLGLEITLLTWGKIWKHLVSLCTQLQSMCGIFRSIYCISFYKYTSVWWYSSPCQVMPRASSLWILARGWPMEHLGHIWRSNPVPQYSANSFLGIH